MEPAGRRRSTAKNAVNDRLEMDGTDLEGGFELIHKLFTERLSRSRRAA